MANNDFSINKKQLEGMADQALDHAKSLGATAAAVEVSEGVGQSVSVRKGKTESIEYSRDKGLSVTVYHGKKLGNSSTSDLSPDAVDKAVEAASTIARFTQEDEFSGLPDKDLLAEDIEDLDLFHPLELEISDALELARRCEAAAFEEDSRVENSDGASFSTNRQQFVLANSLGFSAGYPSSQHSLSCAVIAGRKDDMQRDHWWTVNRNFSALDKAEAVGKMAGKRAVSRLGSKKIATQKVPVLYEACVASSLLGHLVSAISGGVLYRKQSFLIDSIGEKIFPDFINIYDRPAIPCGIASSPFDQEGVRTQERTIVKGGVVSGYFLSNYSAKKLGMHSTGNAGGNHNLIMNSTNDDFSDLLKKMGTGFLVTEMLGMGINGLTGDYSRGAAGFWVENGEIAYPVDEVTIAGNLKEMFLGIDGVGTDILNRTSRQCGSILINNMTVAGN